MYQGESSRLWDRDKKSMFLHSSPIGAGRLLRLLIGHQRGIRYRWFWGVYSPGMQDMWLGYLSQILVLWFYLYMMSRTAFPEVCGQILPLVMLKGRNHSEDRGQLMWAPSVLPVRGLLRVISQCHSFLGLTPHIHLNSIGHGRLIRLMIRPTCHLHYHCLTMPPKAPRDYLFHIRPQDSHAMRHSLPRGLQHLIPSLELSRPLLLLLWGRRDSSHS